jgi:ComF family protein
MSLSEDLSALLRQFVPACCPRCAQASRSGFCTACLNEFARIRTPCPRCGLPGPCTHCPASAAGWQPDRIVAPFLYAPPLAEFVQALKYARQRYLGRILGELLAVEDAGLGGADFIVPVPLHPVRLRERHFNQADEIARPLARRLQIPLQPALIVRRLAGPPQAGRDREQRWRSVQHAFTVKHRLAGAHAVVVDDVVTTGATVNAVAGALKSAGAKRVSVWAVARAVDDGQIRHHPAPRI